MKGKRRRNRKLFHRIRDNRPKGWGEPQFTPTPATKARTDATSGEARRAKSRLKDYASLRSSYL